MPETIYQRLEREGEWTRQLAAVMRAAHTLGKYGDLPDSEERMKTLAHLLGGLSVEMRKLQDLTEFYRAREGGEV